MDEQKVSEFVDVVGFQWSLQNQHASVVAIASTHSWEANQFVIRYLSEKMEKNDSIIFHIHMYFLSFFKNTYGQ